MRIGIIGAGNIGGNLTRRLTALGHQVTVANSRSPETLSALTEETGATAAEAAHERSVRALAKRMTPQAKRAKKEQRQQALLLEVSVTYSMMLETTPDPTVRPPSRIAKRSPCSMAIGVISLIVMRMLSPGMTISTPSGSSIVPVTSVVRK